MVSFAYAAILVAPKQWRRRLDKTNLTVFTDASFAHAVEANGAAFLLALGRAGGGEERDDTAATWTIGGSPIDYHNAVVRANLAEAALDVVIAASLERMRTLGVPGTWHVGPTMQPSGIGARLEAHGFHYGGDDIGMAVALADLPTSVVAPDAFEIVRVETPGDLDRWVAVLGSGFGEGEREAAWVGAMYARIGLGDEQPWRHYLGLLDDVPVATATLFLHEGSAGIYFVYTTPEARRRGIGAAITLAALHGGRRLGAQSGVLGASEPGYSVYVRLGFREVCRIGIYEWHPPDETSSAQEPLC